MKHRLPAIIHWKGNHWVVLYGKKGQKCLIADPAVGMRYLSKKEIAEGWTDWLMLLLEPDPIRFFDQENDKNRWILAFLSARLDLSRYFSSSFTS